MRDRAWRRYKEDQKVITRLTNMYRSGWWRFKDANNIIREEPMVKDFIGTSYNFKYKNITTDSYDSRHKCKYSPNRNSNYRFGDNRRKQSINFLKILKEYELR
jgi:hypothetical protein